MKHIVVNERVCKALGLCGMPSWAKGEDIKIAGFSLEPEYLKDILEFLGKLDAKFPELRGLFTRIGRTQIEMSLKESARAYIHVRLFDAFSSRLEKQILAKTAPREFFEEHTKEIDNCPVEPALVRVLQGLEIGDRATNDNQHTGTVISGEIAKKLQPMLIEDETKYTYLLKDNGECVGLNPDIYKLRKVEKQPLTKREEFGFKIGDRIILKNIYQDDAKAPATIISGETAKKLNSRLSGNEQFNFYYVRDNGRADGLNHTAGVKKL
jgi:hypothetical protein